MNKQNVIELVVSGLMGFLTVSVYYGVKMGINPIWMFSSVILIYTIFGGRFS